MKKEELLKLIEIAEIVASTTAVTEFELKRKYMAMGKVIAYRHILDTYYENN